MAFERDKDRRDKRDRDGKDKDAAKKKKKFRRKKVCKVCINKDFALNYRNTMVLSLFVTDKGKIVSRRISGTCSQHQRLLARTIKQARNIGLLPFSVEAM